MPPTPLDMSEDRSADAFNDALCADDLEQLYEQTPCGLLTTTPSGLIVRVNQALLALTGYERDDLVGRRTFADLLSPGGRIYHETHFGPMLQMQGHVNAIALDLVASDNRRTPVLVNAVLQRTEAGAPVAIRSAVFDARERRTYERELLVAKQRAEEAEVRASSLARTLQESLIPPIAPQIPEFEVAAVYRPAGLGDEVGGDFYDIFQIADDHWIVTVGDVCGKGVKAAVVTALARYTIRAAAVRSATLGDALTDLNDTLLAATTDRYCTMVIVRVRKRDNTWTATVSCAGHPLPLLSKPGGEPVAVGRPGSLLGVLERPTFHEAVLVLEPGDALVLYTDGVTEGRRGKAFFGDDRLRHAVTKNADSALTIVNGVLASVMGFQDSNPHDDIAIVAFRLAT
jgi:sigma-B regulation protein RsbU (phosphoserine phosphatase)